MDHQSTRLSAFAHAPPGSRRAAFRLDHRHGAAAPGGRRLRPLRQAVHVRRPDGEHDRHLRENTEGTGLDPLQFDKVTDIAFFAAGNLTFITDGDIDGLNNRTLTLDAAGQLVAVWSAPNNQPGSGPLQFNLPHAMELDDCKRLWIVDSLNNRVQVTTPNGQFLGQLACFDANQTHDIAMVRLTPQLTRVWVTTGVAGAASGMVSIFDIPSSCNRPPVLDCTTLVASFTVPLPPNNATAMLHSIAVDPATQDVYLALLGNNLPPQKWIQQQP